MPDLHTSPHWLFTLCVSAACCAGAAAIDDEGNEIDVERRNLVYVIGTVRQVEGETALVDLGEAHTVAPLQELAAFRSIGGMYAALGKIHVNETTATSSICRARFPLRKNDLVMTVRELSQLRTGSRHRREVVARDVVRRSGRTSYTTVNNVAFAAALTHYDEQFPQWEKNRKSVVAGTLRSRIVREESDALDRLQKQIDFMRDLYQRGTQTIPAAGAGWEQAIELLAGPTASAGHDLIAESRGGDEDNKNAASPEFAPQDVRAFVIDALFDRRPEQQNFVAVIVASMLTTEPRDPQTYPARAFAESQFPDLADDGSLTENIQIIVRNLRLAN